MTQQKTTFSFGSRGNNENTHEAVIHVEIEGNNAKLYRETGLQVWYYVAHCTRKQAEKLSNFREADALYNQIADDEWLDGYEKYQENE